MSASFPNAKKTFSQVVNGVTKLVAALFNSAYDEIEAQQTFEGPTGGGAQSYSTSITDLLSSYRRGCSVEYKGAADLYVRSGEIMITDASGNRRLRRNPSDTTVTWANIDTGSEANSTVYYVYAVADANATTFTVVISTNATTPTGCTFFKLIGMFFNNASGNIENVRNNYSDNRVKSPLTKAKDTSYLADTDGILVAGGTRTTGDAYIQILSDSSNPPTTQILKAGSSAADGWVSGTALIKKGNYYKVVFSSLSAEYVTFTPIE